MGATDDLRICMGTLPHLQQPAYSAEAPYRSPTVSRVFSTVDDALGRWPALHNLSYQQVLTFRPRSGS
jgi:hypothetical protein